MLNRKIQPTQYSSKQKTRNIPPSWQGILWSSGTQSLNWHRDKNYIIHQVLMYGSLKQIQYLFKKYGKKTVQETFLRYPQNIYSPVILSFVKNFLLDLKNTPIKKSNYAKTLL